MSDTNEPSLATRLAASNWPAVLGLSAFVAALSLYRSYENRPVLGLWSYPYAVLIVCSVVLLLAVVAMGLVGFRRGRALSAPAGLLNLAVLLWGSAYLLSALDDPDNAARVLDGNFFGSAHPFALSAEWISLVLLAVASIAWVMPRLGDMGKKILLTGSALLLVLLVGEGAIRLRALVAPQTQGFPTLTTQMWTRRHVSLNAEGFRDVEHEKIAAPGQRRLLVVGDSFAFGHGVDRIEGRFGEVLASKLSQRLGEPWESLSAAVPDSHTLDEIAFLEQMRGYERDAVILLYVFNDIDYLVPVNEQTVLGDAPDSVFNRVHPVRLLFANSYFFQELFAYGRLAGYARGDQPFVSGHADDDILRRHMDDVERFVEIASRDGVPVLIVPWETWSPSEGSESDRHTRFVREALERGLPIVTLSGAFEGHAKRDLRVSRLDSHPNELANRLAVDWVVDPIAKRIAREAAQ